MPFRNMPLRIAVLLMTTTYVLYLAIQQQINLYIHPRYIVFTFVLAAIGLVLTVIDSYLADHGAKKHSHLESKVLYVPLFVLIGAALLFPARTLTSSTVSQRLTDSGSIVATSESQTAQSYFAGSSKGLRIVDWSQLLNTNTDAAFYANKPAKISGFIYDAGLGADTIWLARFILTCCAVDAQPIGLPVQLTNWGDNFKENEWIEVEGQFEVATTSNGEQLVLIPNSVTTIDQPDNPYAN